MNDGCSVANPTLAEAKVLTRPAERDTNTPPSLPTQTCLLPAGPARAMAWTSAWTLLPIRPAWLAPAPVDAATGNDGRLVVEICGAGCSANGGGPMTSKQYRDAPHCAPAWAFTVDPPR